MINSKTARQIINDAAHLLEQVAIYQAKYGRSYTVTPMSPEEAKSLTQKIFALQCKIAESLDPEALLNPHYKCGEWWERQEVIDIGVVQELVSEACHLVSCCAYFSADSRGMEGSYAVRSAQSTLAGLLHPATRKIALSTGEAIPG
jgi:hypothetical protein